MNSSFTNTFRFVTLQRNHRPQNPIILSIHVILAGWWVELSLPSDDCKATNRPCVVITRLYIVFTTYFLQKISFIYS